MWIKYTDGMFVFAEDRKGILKTQLKFTTIHYVCSNHLKSSCLVELDHSLRPDAFKISVSILCTDFLRERIESVWSSGCFLPCKNAPPSRRGGFVVGEDLIYLGPDRDESGKRRRDWGFARFARCQQQQVGKRRCCTQGCNASILDSFWRASWILEMFKA